MGELNSSELPQLNVDIVRHGLTEYTQREVALEEANDLTEEGIRQVIENAGELASLIGPEEEVAIWSSPMGRALHTAKLVAGVFEERGIRLRRSKEDERPNEEKIKTFNALTEVKNFSWNLFFPLVEGGELTIGGKRFEINPTQTNPKGLNISEYFFVDAIKEIPDEVRASWPPDYAAEVKGFESFFDVTERVLKPLTRLQSLTDKPYRVVMVTHDALTGFVANVFTVGEEFGIDRGNFVNIERRDDRMVVTQIGARTEGDSETNILEKK